MVHNTSAAVAPQADRGSWSRLMPVGVALVAMMLAWFAATSDRVSYSAIQWLSVLAAAVGVALPFFGRWVSAAVMLGTAMLLYIGLGVGGLSGILMIVLSVGLASSVIARIVVALPARFGSNSRVDVKRRNDREVV